MANDCLYLHETIDIVGAGSEAYKRHTGERRTNGRGGGLVGTWQQSGSTGRWPCVVNLWEMAGWDDWAGILEYQYTPRAGQPAELRRWWTRALTWRSGGFDRILVPAPFSPTRAGLIAGGVRGVACLQEVATVRAGQADAFLEAVAAEWVPAASRRGLTLVGAWRTAMRDTEAVLLWSLPTWQAFTDHLKTVDDDPEPRAWTERARQWRTDHRETLLVPSRWCVIHPEWRETARARPARRRRRR